VTPQERNARAYCHSIFADPDELVWGPANSFFRPKARVKKPRWQWYVGAVVQHQHAAE
jgi:predicted RNA-binding protein with PUA-like domain